MPDTPFGGFTAKYVTWRAFVVWIFCLHSQCESSYCEQAIPTLCARWSVSRPVDNALRSSDSVLACIGECREASQEPALCVELKAHSVMQFDITVDGGS